MRAPLRGEGGGMSIPNPVNFWSEIQVAKINNFPSLYPVLSDPSVGN